LGETSKLPEHARLTAAKLSPHFASPSLAGSDTSGASPGQGCGSSGSSGSSAPAAGREARPAASQQLQPTPGARVDQIRGPSRLKSCLSRSPGTRAEEPPLQRTNAHPKTCPAVKFHCEQEVLIVTSPEAEI